MRLVQTVAKPLVDSLEKASGVDELVATVSRGRVELALNLDAHARRPLVAIREQLARAALPGDGEPVQLMVEDGSPQATLIVSSHVRDARALARWAHKKLIPELRGLSPAAAISVEGAPREDIVAFADQRKLAGVGLAPENVVQVLREALRTTQGRALPPAEEIASLSALPLRLPSGEVTVLGEFMRFHSREGRSTEILFDSAEALRVVVSGVAATSERALTEAVTSKVGWLQANGQIPDGISVVPLEELRATRIHARRTLQRATAIGALAALALFLAITGSGRALWGRVMLLLGIWGAALIALWVTATPLSVPTLGGMALASGPVLALSYIRRVVSRRSPSRRLPTGALRAAAGITMVLTPWLFLAGILADHYRGLLLSFLLVLWAGLLLDALWAGSGRKRRAPKGGWRSQSATLLISGLERWRQRIGSIPWAIRVLLLAVVAGSLLVVTSLRYRDVPLNDYRPLLIEWLAASTSGDVLAREDARLALLLADERGVRHREVSLRDAGRTHDGLALVRARLGVESANDSPGWRARMLARLAAQGLDGLGLAPEADADGDAVEGIAVTLHAAEWPALAPLASRVASAARSLSGVARVDGSTSQTEHLVLNSEARHQPESPLSQSQIDRALSLAEGELAIGTWQGPAGRAELVMRLDPPPRPPGRVLISGESRGTPARYLGDLGELVRESVPRRLQLDDDGYLATLTVIPAPGTNAQLLATKLQRVLDGVELDSDQEIAVSGRDDIAAAVGPAWRVALLGGLTLMLVFAWSMWRGSEWRGALREVWIAAGVTLVTAALAGIVGVAPSPPYLLGLTFVFAFSVMQGGTLGGDSPAGPRPFGRRALDTMVVGALVLAAVLPLALLPGAAGALLAPLARVVSIGLVCSLAANLLYLPTVSRPGQRRRR